MGLVNQNGDVIMLGLCEGNYCSEKRKHETGNGRIIVMKKKISGENIGECIWETMKIIAIPKFVKFRDYSALSFTPDGSIAITSQEDSKVWIGKLLGIDANGRIDIDRIAFGTDTGITITFPKSDSCLTSYCNIEGIYFLSNKMLLAVSDKMKKGGKQDFR